MDRLTGGGTIRATSNDKTGPSRLLQGDLFRQGVPHPDLNRPHLVLNGTPSPAVIPRRAFRNVFPTSGSSQRKSNSSRKFYQHPPAHWDPSIATPPPPVPPLPLHHGPPHHYVHPAHYADIIDAPIDCDNFALNANLCLCEDLSSSGTVRSRSGKCLNCGLDRVRAGPTAPYPRGEPSFLLRRAQSDESLTNIGPYDRKLKHQDQHEAYDEADYIYNKRSAPPVRPARTGTHLTRSSTERKASRTGPMLRSRSSVSGQSGSNQSDFVDPRHVVKANVRSPQKQHVVTINTGAGLNNNNNKNLSSVIYLSPGQSDRHNTTMVTVTHPGSASSSGEEEVHATRIEVTDNSRLCRSETSTGSGEPFTEEEESGNSTSESSGETSDKEASSSSDQEEDKPLFQPRIGVKAQAEDRDALDILDNVIAKASLDSAAEESDYDADTSQLESPRKVQTAVASIANHDKIIDEEDEASEMLDRLDKLQDQQLIIPRVRRSSSAKLSHNGQNMTKSQILNERLRHTQSVRESEKSPAPRQREATPKSGKSLMRQSNSESSIHELDDTTSVASNKFRPQISQGFSCEILKELYGSKTSLLKDEEVKALRQRTPGNSNLISLYKLLFVLCDNLVAI